MITIDINQGRNTSWEDYGFKKVHGGGGVRFWPFFSSEVYVCGQWETRTWKTADREDGISLQLVTIGVTEFDIQPGAW